MNELSGDEGASVSVAEVVELVSLLGIDKIFDKSWV